MSMLFFVPSLFTPPNNPNAVSFRASIHECARVYGKFDINLIAPDDLTLKSSSLFWIKSVLSNTVPLDCESLNNISFQLELISS